MMKFLAATETGIAIKLKANAKLSLQTCTDFAFGVPQIVGGLRHLCLFSFGV